jgi:hypothetical protein
MQAFGCIVIGVLMAVSTLSCSSTSVDPRLTVSSAVILLDGGSILVSTVHSEGFAVDFEFDDSIDRSQDHPRLIVKTDGQAVESSYESREYLAMLDDFIRRSTSAKTLAELEESQIEPLDVGGGTDTVLIPASLMQKVCYDGVDGLIDAHRCAFYEVSTQ